MLRWLDTVFPRRALFQRDRRLLHLFLGRVLASTGFSIVIPFLSLYLHGERRVPMSLVGSIFFFAALARFGFTELGQALRDEIFMRYCLISLVLFTVMSQLISTLSVYSVQWAGISKVQLGALYSLNGLMVVFLQFPVVRALAPFRMTTALVAGSILYAVGYAMMGLGRGMPLLTAAMFVVTLGEIVTTPASMNLVANFSSEPLRGRYMGVFGLFNSFGWSIGPLVGGVLLDLASGRSMLLWTPIACLTLLAAAGYWHLRRRVDRAMDLNDDPRAPETATA